MSACCVRCCFLLQLFYNNGRGSIQANPGLCPDPNWPAADSGNANSDCWVNAARSTRCAAACAVTCCQLLSVCIVALC
jgi:hypothetical protein